MQSTHSARSNPATKPFVDHPRALCETRNLKFHPSVIYHFVLSLMSTRLCPRATSHRSALATVSIQLVAARAPAAVLRGPVALPRREQRSLFTPIRPRVCELRCCRRTYHYYTDIERNAERVLQTATSRVEEFDRASKAVRTVPSRQASTRWTELVAVRRVWCSGGYRVDEDHEGSWRSTECVG